MNREEIPVVRNIFIAIMLTTFVAGYDIARQNEKLEVKAQEVQVVVSGPTSTPKAIVEAQDTPESYIREVFGEHSDKAFLLLKGKGPGTCAENRNLDPKAVNDNRMWGGIGRDVSIFQINDVFHPVKELNLENDWKANIDYAWRMYKNDNFSFQRWTCGKVYGI